ncbi:MAG: hypothetical protein F6J90_30995 [Moorea sp. SIOASIH]|uniref:hypothetical protein n=1 Tax=Moorena sp. SIOASIH TaxID=2607817 RepID=UPI0013B6D6DE|nr:hypothetical protein [Moorena sp. SIOASIH]NEO40525.1 hypothetical protein [Moorena sp. SIOASIH]
MTNLLKQLTSTFKAQKNTEQNRDKTTVVTTPTTVQNDESPVLRQFPIWEIAFLLISVSIIFNLGPHMIGKSKFTGKYNSKVEISVEGITVTTEIDTRESSAGNDNTEEEETEETSQLSSSSR